MTDHTSTWTKRAGERLMPWFVGVTTALSLVLALFYLVAVLAAVGFYLLCAAIVIPVCLLIMRLGGWKIDWKAWK